MPAGLSERQLLQRLAARVPAAGDDGAVIPYGESFLVWTTDMLWREVDLPAGIAPATIGWRAVAVSLSDIAAMGAEPIGALLALGAPAFDAELTDGIADGVLACCEAAHAEYLGGDLSGHRELTLCSSALGRSPNPVRRRGARVGDLVGVTGELGRTAVALRLFRSGDVARANELFAFPARVAEGQALAPYVTSMMDVSDGLARSLHQLAEASGVGFRIRERDVPLLDAIDAWSSDQQDRREMGFHTGEDFELLFTISSRDLDDAQASVSLAVIGEVTEAGVELRTTEGLEPLSDRGYEHGVG